MLVCKIYELAKLEIPRHSGRFSAGKNIVRRGSRVAAPDPRFWGPKIELFLYLFWSHFAQHTISFISTIFHNLSSKIVQPRFAQHIISQLMQIKLKPQLLFVTSFISCNMTTNTVLIFVHFCHTIYLFFSTSVKIFFSLASLSTAP